MTQKPKTKIVALMLSVEKGAWAEIQAFGQGVTFLSSLHEQVRYVRYFGNGQKPKFHVRGVLSLKQIQHLAAIKSQRNPRNKILTRLAHIRFGDKILNGFSSGDLSQCILEETHTGSKLFLEPMRLVIDIPEHWASIGAKTLAAFRYALENFDFEYLFRSNSSSYVDSDALLSRTRDLPSNYLYAGFPGKSNDGLDFASGAGILMSRDVVELIVENSQMWRHGLIDDVAIAELISRLPETEIELTPLSRVDFRSLSEAKSVPKSVIQDGFHFRCKTGQASETIEIMRYIHQVKTGQA